MCCFIEQASWGGPLTAKGLMSQLYISPQHKQWGALGSKVAVMSYPQQGELPFHQAMMWSGGCTIAGKAIGKDWGSQQTVYILGRHTYNDVITPTCMHITLC